MATIAVLDADQLGEIVRTEVIRALDDLRAILHAAAIPSAALRSETEDPALLSRAERGHVRPVLHPFRPPDTNGQTPGSSVE